ncbi:DEAD/DEAH box helicase [Cytobacillus oceanisediminis]|uniref:DEAD/DEAH box helicase n=1 Tax=Cytobacillus oceanisediminis TaxID=665099 RepID=UPI001FB1D8EC|nr:DEAD/DEAH box helicase [Cytobacillus oceanisediminis]UOE58191.1 DEAD/DEAH box helicase [Cytobacillus oceanisediminis]
MFSLRLSGDLLDIRIESKLSHQGFRDYTDFMRSLPGAYYVEAEYKWMVPKKNIDIFAQRYEDMTAWHTTIEAIKEIEEVILPEFPTLTDFSDFKLHPYEFQQQGISFLSHVGSGIIGDDMGLGKTVQTAGAAHMLHKQGKANKILVICPASLKYQWSKEIDKFLGHTNIVIDGKTPKQKQKALKDFVSGDYLFGIANYELVRTMADQFKEHHYDVIIADEAHRLKNRNSATYKAVSSLSCTNRMASTGTPLQNNIEELYALMEWVQPGLLGNITNFRKKHIVYASKFGRRYVPIGPKRLGELRRNISPYMLRRLKKDVAQDLPPMIFHRRDVEMNKSQSVLYEKVQADFLQLLEQLSTQEVEGKFDDEGNWVEEKRSNEDKILGYLYMMVAISDHPALLKHGRGMSKQYQELIPEDIKSPKLEELLDICKDRMESGVEKIVIFTQFAQMQSIIAEELSKLGEVQTVNGSMTSAKRQEAFDSFQHNENCRFLIGTDAMNYGVNLQFANTLINYDCPWNPAVFEQRAGRVHRIGSTHDVVDIISLVTLGTIDEKIQETLEEKRRLGEAVIERNASERSTMNSLIASIKKQPKS